MEKLDRTEGKAEGIGNPPQAWAPASAAFLALLAAYIFSTRLFALGLKPVQHDESMFAYYSYNLSQGNGYEFMPILHGPLLEWVTALVFLLIGDSDATMRLFPALCGIGAIGLIFVFRASIGRRSTLLAMALLAISPTVLFFSRFCRNDMPFLFFAMLIVAVGWLYSRRFSSPYPTLPPTFLAMLLPILFGIAVSIKESYVIFAFILATFCLGCRIHGKVQRIPEDDIPYYNSVVHAMRLHWFPILVGTGLSALFLVAIFTSFFEHMHHRWGVIDDFKYWANENKHRRIIGPFHFYLIHLSIYELPFLAFWTGSLVAMMGRFRDGPKLKGHRNFFYGWLVISVTTLVLFWDAALPESFDLRLHMQLGLHLWMALQLIVVVGITGWKHLNRERYVHAFFDYWAGASFLVYSYAGEKVPWVTLHIAFPMIVSCALYADLAIRWCGEAPAKKAAAKKAEPKGRGRRRAKQNHVQEKDDPATTPTLRGSRFAATAALAAFSVIGIGWSVWLSNFLVFANSGSPIERHTYASSHTEFHAEMNRVVAEAEASPLRYNTSIAYEGQVSWPLEWTLRRFSGRRPSVSETTDASFVIIDNYIWEELPGYMDRYDWTPVRFRHYWQPMPLDWDAMKRPGLLWREDEDGLNPGLTEWKKLFMAMLRRDEDYEGPARWEYLGGLDAHIGRKKVIEP